MRTIGHRFEDWTWIRDWTWAHSPDLNPPYFYLWRYLKDNVHENNPQSIGELKAAITAKIREIPKEECVRVIDNLRDVCKCAFNAEDAPKNVN
jgi:exonuclease V gamma subunit